MDSIDWPDHDFTLWGVRWLDGEPPQSVRRVADVIRLRTTEFVPASDACHEVLNELVQALPDVGSWVMLQPGRRPVAIHDGDVWQGVRSETPGVGWNWLHVPVGQLHCPFPATSSGIEMTGLRGAMACLRTTRPSRPDAFDVGLAALIAVPDVVAAQVAARGAPSSPVAALVVDALLSFSGPSAAAPAWQSDYRYTAVLGLRKLKGHTGARKTIAAEFGFSDRTVGKWKAWVERNEAKDLRERAMAKQIQALKAA